VGLKINPQIFFQKLNEFKRRALQRFSREWTNLKWNTVFRERDLEARFTRIYLNRMWKGSESASGYGSGFEYTHNLRRELKSIIEKFNIKSVLDLACGDCNWIKEFFQRDQFEYLGVDIVRPLIEENSRMYGSNRIKFLTLDVISAEIPSADLVICRDLLFHLSNQDILGVLKKIMNSDSKYLLVTTHIEDEMLGLSNLDIKGGDFRRVDLSAPPFSIPNCELLSFEDWRSPDAPRLMKLFDIGATRKYWF
jgi:2-polyprenyl-3-methyl-5-hydroxy-6-metoxy-1,4-benzoquinol methylase